jgi:mannose-1-phosphate guanylyltransferase/mannose-6-phosphate isomerase
MSGGAGTRLWPLSTNDKPKQFHALSGARTLFAETLLRTRATARDILFTSPIVLCGQAHTAAVKTALAEAGGPAATIVVEPAPRNTAAVAATAAIAAHERDPDALVLLTPSDHAVAAVDALHEAIASAAPFARDRIVTFGVRPTRPATGYGYIESGEALAKSVLAVTAFKEKPDAARAQSYFESGRHWWNSGMFLFSPAVLLEEFAANPQIRNCAMSAWSEAERSGDEIRLGARYTEAPALSLDVAVMEHTARAAVVPCEMGWTDIGAWDEVWRLSPQDQNGNATQGSSAAADSKNSLVFAEGVTVCVAGVEDLIVVATREAVLVVPRARAQEVRALRELAAKLT